jgi:hypothetical protein
MKNKKTKQSQNPTPSVESTICQKCGEIHSGECKTILKPNKVRGRKLKIDDIIVGFNYFSKSICFNSTCFKIKYEDLLVELTLFMIEKGFDQQTIEDTVFPIFDIKFFKTNEYPLNFSNGENHYLEFYQFADKDRTIYFHLSKE